MQLGTFGAIMGFAMELEMRATSLYEARAELPSDLREAMIRSAKKKHRRLEKARREGVVELALEPISGLDGDDYPLEGPTEKGRAGALRGAIALEETSARFYRDAGKKLPMQEIARLFTRCAKNNQENLAWLRLALGKSGEE